MNRNLALFEEKEPIEEEIISEEPAEEEPQRGELILESEESGEVVENDDGIMIKDADLSIGSDAVEGEVPEEAVQYVKVMKVVGQPKEVGVEYDGYKFPALANGGVYESGKLYAVRIIVKHGVVIDTLPTYMVAQ